MQFTDLFSHKIHSSTDEWAEKLVDLAFVFHEFHGYPYDRLALEERLSLISPRASSVARDFSKFRDEISAYPAYLGLYRVELRDDNWFFRLSDTARRFLVSDEPNVPAFMLLQLLLFQYPNGMGAAYYSNGNRLRLQANSRDRTLSMIKKEVHLSPMRLICKAISVKAEMESTDVFNTTLLYNEISALANDSRIYTDVSPDEWVIEDALDDFHKGYIKSSEKFENRFHILKHTNFLVPNRQGIQFRTPYSDADKAELSIKIDMINRLRVVFTGFDGAVDADGIANRIFDNSWGEYFDGVRTLPSEVVAQLSSEVGLFTVPDIVREDLPTPSNIIEKNTTYSFRPRNSAVGNVLPLSRTVEFMDPELTRIRRQKSNLIHKIVLQRLEEYLEGRGCSPVENDHIDLFVTLPSDEKFLFEVKSFNADNLLSQTRKGVSQLYEYRYRYQDQIGYDIRLCIVFQARPVNIEWIEDYLCSDRDIGVLWIDESGKLCYPEIGKNHVLPLIEELT